MKPAPDSLPEDVESLRAFALQMMAERNAVIAERNEAVAERDAAMAAAQHKDEINAQLRQLLRQAMGIEPKSERLSRLDRDQLQLALEDLEQASARDEAQEGKREPARAARRPRRNRGHLPAHLPHRHRTIEPESTICPCCQGQMHVIGEEVSKRLHTIPARYEVIVTHRPKLACRACEEMVQAPAPEYLIKSGLPTEATVASVLVAKFAWNLPLYRQAKMMASQGLDLDRSTLAFWVGTAAAELMPLYERLKFHLLRSSKLVVDETTVPVLDPGRGKTKTGYFWTMARDDRPWGGSDPPAVVYHYAPGRGAEHMHALLGGYCGIVQCDGYAAYKQLAGGNQVTVAFCWSHLRRQFFKLAKEGKAPIATEALARIAELYAIEKDIRGTTAANRRDIRQTRSAPRVEAFRLFLEQQLGRVSQKSKIASVMRYGLRHWEGLVRFLDDGRIEMDTNIVERLIRPQVLTRKNCLFAGHDAGGEFWAVLGSLIETCKLHNVEPQTWLTDVLTKLVNLWPNDRLDELLPWAWAAAATTEQIAA